MAFYKNILFTLISTTILITAPAFGMNGEDEPSKGIIPVSLSTDIVDTGVDLDALAVTYTHLRSTGNAASDSELVAFLLDGQGYKGWSMLNSTQQAQLISKVSGKPMTEIPQPSLSSASTDSSGEKKSKESKGWCSLQ